MARRRDVPVAEILGRPGPVVFVFGIQDPGNLGAIVRVAEAAGGAGSWARRARPTSSIPAAVRASAGSVLRIPVSGRVSFEPFAADARAAGPPDLRRRRRRGAEPVRGSDPARPCWCVGAEGPDSRREPIATSTAA